MFAKIKLYIVLGGLVLSIGTIVYFLKTHAFVEKSILSEKDTTISNQSKVIITKNNQLSEKDTTIFRLRQEIDMKDVQIKEQQIVQDGTNKRLQACKNAENTCCEELKHAEETGGIIRYNWLGKIKKKK